MTYGVSLPRKYNNLSCRRQCIAPMTCSEFVQNQVLENRPQSLSVIIFATFTPATNAVENFSLNTASCFSRAKLDFTGSPYSRRATCVICYSVIHLEHIAEHVELHIFPFPSHPHSINLYMVTSSTFSVISRHSVQVAGSLGPAGWFYHSPIWRERL